jgi:dTDP-4-dehydrorhamnose 3,5-epimerase-like enzyme
MSNLVDVRVLNFRRIVDDRGALTPLEGTADIPFEIKRVYYIYDVSRGASRAGHSHKELQQVLISVSGSFDVHLDDGTEKKTFTLNRPDMGLFVPQMVWRDIDNFSGGAVCLSITSAVYDEQDYYRKYDDFLEDKLRVRR